MIAIPAILASYAQEAGMEVPEDPDDWNSEENNENFPHFYVFCAMQLGAPMPTPGAGWDNAKIVAGFTKEAVKEVTPEALVKAGFAAGHSK